MFLISDIPQCIQSYNIYLESFYEISFFYEEISSLCVLHYGGDTEAANGASSNQRREKVFSNSNCVFFVTPLRASGKQLPSLRQPTSARLDLCQFGRHLLAGHHSASLRK